ncbi:hypothetical protein KKF05_00015 [Patescibacteria group bacterium]|nr:hypothetical protein [Patescibacteria group bacterium]MBU1915892.1 hypothetical protein [Patescibacteria group bacterium]
MKKNLIVSILTALVLLAWPLSAQAQGWEFDLLRDNPQIEAQYYFWLEAAIRPPHPVAAFGVEGSRLSISCVSLGRVVYERPGHGYCGIHVGEPGRPSVGLGLSMSRSIRPFPDPAAVFDLSFDWFSLVVIIEYGDQRQEQHVFLMIRLHRLWQRRNQR